MTLPRIVIQYVLIGAIQNHGFFLKLREKVNDECFEDNELLEFLVWRTISTLYEKHDNILDVELVRVDVLRTAQSNGYQLDETELDNFLKKVKTVQVNMTYAKEAARQWLIERIVVNKLIRELNRPETNVESVIEKATKNLQKTSFTETLLDGIIKSYKKDNIEKDALIPTGVPFIDSRIGGGFLPGEVGLLLGPTGAGKTTLCVQIACAAAQYNKIKGKRQRIVLVTYEDSGVRIKERIIAYLAKINRQRFMEIQSIDDLSDVPGSQIYEQKLIMEQCTTLKSEKDRIHDAAWIDDYLVVLDFSGKSGRPEEGCGGVNEIASALQVINQDKRGFSFVIIDWAGIMVERYLDYQNVRDPRSEYTRQLKILPDQLFRKIASGFSTAVLLSHQLAGATNKFSPTADFSHGDAEGCKSIAVSMWHVMTLGIQDSNTKISKFAVKKTRRQELTEPALVKLNGEFSEFIDVSKQYIIDNRTKQILHAKDVLETNKRKTSRDELTDI